MLKREAPHVVIIGAGFGGLAAAKALRGREVRITLIDRTNHHLFQPLLYQVATAALAAPDIAAPVRALLSRQSNASVWLADVERIDAERRQVLARGQRLDYDYLILAAGMRHGYFGHDSWAELAPGLKTLAEALDIRRRVLRAFEAAEIEPALEERRAWTTFVVIGGGPTGVELAGALAEIAGRTLAHDFRRFDPATTRVVLVEAGPRLLPSFDARLSASAERELRGLGIDVRTGVAVSEIGADFVTIGDDRIRARTVLWAAGVRANERAADLGVPVDKLGRIWVQDDLSVPDRPELFVVGDLIAKTQDGKALPGVAQLAMQSGRHAALNVLRSVRGEPRQPFRYVDKGSMATIGRNKAVAEIGRFRFSGVLAWWLWLTVHLMSLVEFRRRLAVLFEWAWAYLSWQRSSRVILELPVSPADPNLSSHAPPRVLRTGS
ncbi:MAG TPA: NAD(P)/FAD-dependent oxidoreductase [Polyangiaceae bacterium]|nr:NAD(P)/FAD-dependent oxidoreductase [Polyangiaceae bacterium]